MKKIICLTPKIVCLILDHDTVGFNKTETYMGYSGVLQENKPITYKRCIRCGAVWKEIWCGFCEIYWERVN